MSARLVATQPIVVERAMYLSRPDQPFAAGHSSAGVTAPATSWYLAEGATGGFFDLFILIANPGPTAAIVEARYLTAAGRTLTKSYVVAANSRRTIYVDAEQFPGEGAALSDAAVSTSADFDQRRADHRRAGDVVAAAELVRSAQLAGRDRDRASLGAGRGRGRRCRRHADLHPARQHRHDGRLGARHLVLRGRLERRAHLRRRRQQPLQRRRGGTSSRPRRDGASARSSRASAPARRRSSSSARCTPASAACSGRPAPTRWARVCRSTPEPPLWSSLAHGTLSRAPTTGPSATKRSGACRSTVSELGASAPALTRRISCC